MNTKVKIGNSGGVITLTDKHYVAAGGEATIYANGGRAFKIYHDKHKVLPDNKLKELHAIQNPNVIVPQDMIFDASTGERLGFTSNFVNNVEPLLKFFTRTFKQDNNLDPAMIAELAKQLQLVTNDIHGARCLIVDFNELNVLVNIGNKALSPYFIDVDSYATPSFKATAIMDSVRDRRVSTTHNGHLVYNPDIMSDWFSWGILTFWLYTNIHPFRGSHPNYKPREKQKQFDDGISVFHKGVRTPPSVNNFNVIPKRHLEWYEAVFLRNERSVPPLPDSMVPLKVPTQIVLIKGTNTVDVIQLAAYGEDVINVQQMMGMNYVITTKKIYVDHKEMAAGCDKVRKTLLCPATDGTAIVATLSGNTVTFTELIRKQVVGTISSNDMFVRNSCIYTVAPNGKLVENSFTAIGDKVIHRITEIENVSVYTTKFFEGCVIQDLLGKIHVVVPLKKGSSISKHIPNLDGYRVVGAKSERHITIVIAEKNGRYDKFVIVFKKDTHEIDVRIVEDVTYDTINFTVMENGLCIHLANDKELELFSDNRAVTVLADPPLDATMKLFNTTNGVFFINGNTIHNMKKK